MQEEINMDLRTIKDYYCLWYHTNYVFIWNFLKSRPTPFLSKFSMKLTFGWNTFFTFGSETDGLQLEKDFDQICMVAIHGTKVKTR